MQNKPCWNSKSMGMHFAHAIRILKIKSKNFFLRPDLAPSNLLFLFQCLLRKVGLAPSWPCHALFLLAPNSWDPKLSADVSFVSVLAMVLSEYWKKLEENFRNKIISAISQNDENYENIFSSVFFNILKEQMTRQKKLWSAFCRQKVWGRHASQPRNHC